MRGAIGGMFIGLGLITLLNPGEEVLSLALGVGWLGVLAGKVMAIVQDKLTLQMATPGMVTNAVLALCFLLGADIL